MHPELIRLGFRDYVHFQGRLFPHLPKAARTAQADSSASGSAPSKAQRASHPLPSRSTPSGTLLPQNYGWQGPPMHRQMPSQGMQGTAWVGKSMQQLSGVKRSGFGLSLNCWNFRRIRFLPPFIVSSKRRPSCPTRKLKIGLHIRGCQFQHEK